MAKKKSQDLVSNRKAFHDYDILDTYEAGISLVGTEVKSLRDHQGILGEAYVHIMGNELYLKGAHISHYSHGNVHNHEEKRDRKLLMHRQEIEKLRKRVQEKGITLIPLAFYLKKGRIKLKIATAKGKRQFEKRQSLKEKEQKKEIQRALKS
jgi:SsrA-binding protein